MFQHLEPGTFHPGATVWRDDSQGLPLLLLILLRTLTCHFSRWFRGGASEKYDHETGNHDS